MKILILCNKPPYPPTEGGPIAMNMIIEGLLNAGHQIKVLAFNSNKTRVNLQSIPGTYIDRTGLELIPVDLGIKPVKAFLNLFTSRSYHVERFISRNFQTRLKEILQNESFDVVQFEMLFMAPYLETVKKYSGAKTILRAHNIEHMVWERVEKSTPGRLKRYYLHHLVETLKKYELGILSGFDGIAAITWKDADFFRKNLKGNIPPVEAIPFGIDLEKFPPGDEHFEFPSLFSIGAMDWMPNSEGIRWFLDEVWPLIHEKIPDLPYYIAGRHMPDWITRCRRANVKVVGEVECARDFMHSKAIMIVPLLSGSGIRIKIIEGMAAGKCIVSTSIGAEGIHYEDGKNIKIADSPEAFADAVSVLMDKESCLKMGREARKLIENEYRSDQIIAKLTSFYQKTGS